VRTVPSLGHNREANDSHVHLSIPGAIIPGHRKDTDNGLRINDRALIGARLSQASW